MRIERLQQTLKEKNIDVALFFSLDNSTNTNTKYFTDYNGLGVFVVTKRASFLLVPEMEYEKACQKYGKVYKTEKKKYLLETLSKMLSKNKIKKVGIEESKCSVSLYKNLKKSLKSKYADISMLCAEIRMVKEAREIKYIETACSIADKVFAKICKDFKFKTENELRAFIEKEITATGCELSFPPIVASGRSSSQPHYEGNKKITRGFLLLDFGAKYKGYCSDMSRTLYVGKPSKKELGYYALVLGVLETCERRVAKNVKFNELYNSTIEMFGLNSEFFTHALGHGLGLEIHEPPSLYLEDKKNIKDNIVFTIEPGLYFQGKYGIRIEDTVMLKNNRLKILTKSRKELVIIK
ncbi:MAG: Xaa-Pro peptidase family protein [Nanoarchaeota archaeon]